MRTHNTLSILGLLLFTCLLIGASSCAKDEDNDDDNTREDRFPGVVMRDFQGNFIDCYQNCEEDWMFHELSSLEMKYLDFPDQVVVNGQDATEVMDVIAYPNPLPRNHSLFIDAKLDGSAFFRMAIIDSWGRPNSAYSASLTQDNSVVRLIPLVFDRLKTLENHRLYFAYYDSNEEIIHSGFGDFAICDSTAYSNPLDCFLQ